MEDIVWTTRLATGVQALDDQHKQLIRKLQELTESIRDGEPRKELLDLFDFLETYMRDHFREEELEMDRLQCPEAELNRRGHARFLMSFQALRARLSSEGPSEALAKEVHHELAEWFVHHILLVDTRLYARAMSQP